MAINIRAIIRKRKKENKRTGNWYKGWELVLSNKKVYDIVENMCIQDSQQHGNIEKMVMLVDLLCWSARKKEQIEKNLIEYAKGGELIISRHKNNKTTTTTYCMYNNNELQRDDIL